MHSIYSGIDRPFIFGFRLMVYVGHSCWYGHEQCGIWLDLIWPTGTVSTITRDQSQYTVRSSSCWQHHIQVLRYEATPAKLTHRLLYIEQKGSISKCCKHLLTERSYNCISWHSWYTPIQMHVTWTFLRNRQSNHRKAGGQVERCQL